MSEPDVNPLHQRTNPALRNSRPWREIMAFYRYLKPGLRLMKLPVLGPVLQKMAIKDGNDANWFIPVGERLPVGEELPRGRQQVLPGVVIERLLEAAHGIFAMAACPCRTAFKCQAHPWDLGCLHLGPTILHIPSEAEIFRVDQTRMLSICFCCECCCDVRLMLRTGPDRYWDMYNHRLPGLRLLVSQACTRCGACVDACYGGERVIRMGPDRVEIHERCLGCGRCIQACPQGALSLEFDPQTDIMAALLARIGERVEISAPDWGVPDWGVPDSGVPDSRATNLES